MLIPFTRITETTARRIVELRLVEPSEFSELSLAYTFHWASTRYHAAFAEIAGCGVIRFSFCGRHYYTPPFGPGDHAQALAAVRAQEPGRLMLGLLTDAEAQHLAQDGWIIQEVPWGCDYVYRQSDLATLPGSRYQAKRNFCHRFEKAGSWRYGPLDIASARHVLEAWRAERADILDSEAETEYRALCEELKSNTLGGVLYQNDRPVAFALGERLSQETLLVAYEKAIPSVPGAFQMINREFARREGAAYRWLNRASADAHPALIKAKESYHPARRLRKFFAIDATLPGTSAHIAKAEETDFNDIVSLWQQVFGDDEPFIRSVITANPGFVVRDDNGLAAMGFALPRPGSRYVYAMATRPDCRGLGYATAILETIHLAFLPEPLSVVPSDATLIPFYERNGFQTTTQGAYITMTRPTLLGYHVPEPMN